MFLPVRGGVAGSVGRGAGIGDLSMEVAGRHDVKNDFEVLMVDLFDDAGGIGKDVLVERKRPMACVPA